MDYFKNKFLSEIGRIQLEERGKYVCGDCKYFETKKCPIGIEYKLAPVCYFYKASKEQRKHFKKSQGKKIKEESITMSTKIKKKNKNKHKFKEDTSKRIFTKDGYVKCNLRFGFEVKRFLENLIEEKGWKCQRRRCKDKKTFQVRAKHPTKRIDISERLIYTITETYVEFKLACPGCNFLHNFPTDVSKEIREHVKSLDNKKIFTKSPETEEEFRLMTKFVSQLVFPDGFEDDPLMSAYKGTIGYKSFRGKIRKAARENDTKPARVIGLIFNNSKGCLVLDSADFIVIPGSIFKFGAA